MQFSLKSLFLVLAIVAVAAREYGLIFVAIASSVSVAAVMLGNAKYHDSQGRETLALCLTFGALFVVSGIGFLSLFLIAARE